MEKSAKTGKFQIKARSLFRLQKGWMLKTVNDINFEQC